MIIKILKLFQVRLGEKDQKYLFESNSLKSEQNFAGTDIIIQDISKITSLKFDFIKMILNKINLNQKFQMMSLLRKNILIVMIILKLKN